MRRNCLTSRTLIDVISTTKPENLCDIKVIPTAMSAAMSDHDIIGEEES